MDISKNQWRSTGGEKLDTWKYSAIYLVKQNYIFFEYQFFQVKNVKKKHIHCNLTSFYVGIK